MTGRPPVLMLTSQQPVRYSRFFEREAVSLTASGRDVTLVGLGDEPETVERGVRLVSVPLRRGAAKRRTLAAIRDIAGAADAGALHCFDPWTLEIGLRLARSRPGLKVIYDSTELFPAVYRDRADWPLALRLAAAARVRRIEARACRECAAIIETNATRAERFRRRGVVPKLVPNYPPLELLAEPATTRKPVIAYTGLACRERGFDRLLEAFARVAAGILAARLLLIGDYDPRTGIEAWSRRFVRERGLEDRVEFAGRLPYARLLERLRDCLCGVILFQPDRENDYTGQPNKLFEFMGAGLAVLASGFPEMAGVIRRHRCGWTVDPTDVAAIAGALRRALANPARAVDAGMRGRQAVLERYHWGVAEAALLEAYREAGC